MVNARKIISPQDFIHNGKLLRKTKSKSAFLSNLFNLINQPKNYCDRKQVKGSSLKATEAPKKPKTNRLRLSLTKAEPKKTDWAAIKAHLASYNSNLTVKKLIDQELIQNAIIDKIARENNLLELVQCMLKMAETIDLQQKKYTRSRKVIEAV